MIDDDISIHAPSRERLHINKIVLHSKHFNPRSLAGATLVIIFFALLFWNFNPRSLAGATF